MTENSFKRNLLYVLDMQGKGELSKFTEKPLFDGVIKIYPKEGDENYTICVDYGNKKIFEYHGYDETVKLFVQNLENGQIVDLINAAFEVFGGSEFKVIKTLSGDGFVLIREENKEISLHEVVGDGIKFKTYKFKVHDRWKNY